MHDISSEPTRSMANTPVSQPRLSADLVVELSQENMLYIAVDPIHIKQIIRDQPY